MTVIIDEIDKKPEDCWNCNFCVRDTHIHYCAVNNDRIHWEDGIVNPDCPVKTLIRCKDCRYFDTNWRCVIWHQFVVEHGWCFRAERRPKDV